MLNITDRYCIVVYIISVSKMSRCLSIYLIAVMIFV